MVTDQDKSLGKSQWTQAGRQCDLRRLVDDAIVKCSSREQRTMGMDEVFNMLLLAQDKSLAPLTDPRIGKWLLPPVVTSLGAPAVGCS